jgi:hypothetical protein
MTVRVPGFRNAEGSCSPCERFALSIVRPYL